MLVGAVKVSTSIGEKAAIVLKGFGVLLGCDGCNVSFFHSVVALDVVAIQAMAQISSVLGETQTVGCEPFVRKKFPLSPPTVCRIVDIFRISANTS